MNADEYQKLALVTENTPDVLALNAADDTDTEPKGDCRDAAEDLVTKKQAFIDQNRNPRLHTVPGCTISGRKLEAGEVLEATDVYESSNGQWEPCPCPGLKLGEGVACIWIRPGGLD